MHSRIGHFYSSAKMCIGHYTCGCSSIGINPEHAAEDVEFNKPALLTIFHPIQTERETCRLLQIYGDAGSYSDST